MRGSLACTLNLFRNPTREKNRKILEAFPYRHLKISLAPEIFRGVMQTFYVRCGWSLHSAETAEDVNLQFFRVRPQLREYDISVPLTINSNCSLLTSFKEKRSYYSTHPKTPPQDSSQWMHFMLLQYSLVFISPNASFCLLINSLKWKWVSSLKIICFSKLLSSASLSRYQSANCICLP